MKMKIVCAVLAIFIIPNSLLAAEKASEKCKRISQQIQVEYQRVERIEAWGGEIDLT
jgi:hypothetical protein